MLKYIKSSTIQVELLPKDMLIELGTDRLSNLKGKTLKTVQGTVAGLLGLAGTYGISPNIVRVEIASSPPAKTSLVTSRIALPESDPNIYVTCGGEGYLDNESVLVVEEDESSYTESLGIIPGECGNPEDQTNPELTLQPEPTPVPKPEPKPTPTPLFFPRYPQIPLPVPDPSITQRPQIKGDQECISGANSSLDYLNERASLEYYFVLRYTTVIKCTDDQYATVLDEPPTILLSRVFLKDNRGSRAAVIVHETCHLWQVRRSRDAYPTITPLPVGVGHGSEAEAECYTVEYYFLKKVGTNQETLDLFSDWVYQRIKIRIPLQ